MQVIGSGFSDVNITCPNVGVNYFVHGNPDSTVMVISERFIVAPAVSYDYSGRSVANAGDINGDGYDDLIIGVPFAAKVYVLFGTADGYSDTSEGFTVFGAKSSDLTGWSVSGAGDVNRDSFGDLVIGAPGADGSGSNAASAGVVYVLFGRHSEFTDIHLDALMSAQGYRIVGSKSQDCLGLSVSGARDVNGDGYDDIIVGALRMNSFYAGAAYVIYGKRNRESTTLNLGSLSPSGGFMFSGGPWMWLGYSVSGVGDVNRDLFDDVLVGSTPRKVSAGMEVAYLLYGKQAAATSDLSAQNLTAAQGVVLRSGGVVVSGIGDVNFDGYDDMLVGSDYGYASGGGYVLQYAKIAVSSRSPTAAPSPVPTTAKPTYSPSHLPSVSPSHQPTSLPTAPTFTPTISPTNPTSVPSRAPSSPTFQPTGLPTAPTLQPTTAKPSALPTVLPTTSEPSSKLVVPSGYPSSQPSLKRTTAPAVEPTLLPTAVQTVAPTGQPSTAPPTANATQANATIVYSDTVHVVTGGRYERIEGRNIHFILNTTTDSVVTVTGQGGKDKFTVLPAPHNVLTVLFFNAQFDLIDLVAFTSILGLPDLHITRGSAVIHLPNNQTIRLKNIQPENVTADHFIFYTKALDVKSARSGYITNIVAAGSALLGAVFLYFLCKHRRVFLGEKYRIAHRFDSVDCMENNPTLITVVRRVDHTDGTTRRRSVLDFFRRGRNRSGDEEGDFLSSSSSGSGGPSESDGFDDSRSESKQTLSVESEHRDRVICGGNGSRSSGGGGSVRSKSSFTISAFGNTTRSGSGSRGRTVAGAASQEPPPPRSVRRFMSESDFTVDISSRTNDSVDEDDSVQDSLQSIITLTTIEQAPPVSAAEMEHDRNYSYDVSGQSRHCPPTGKIKDQRSDVEEASDDYDDGDDSGDDDDSVSYSGSGSDADADADGSDLHSSNGDSQLSERFADSVGSINTSDTENTENEAKNRERKNMLPERMKNEGQAQDSVVDSCGEESVDSVSTVDDSEGSTSGSVDSV